MAAPQTEHTPAACGRIWNNLATRLPTRYSAALEVRGLPEQLPARTTAGRLRRSLFSLPGRRTRSARHETLHLPQGWPWQGLFLTALRQVRAAT